VTKAEIKKLLKSKSSTRLDLGCGENKHGNDWIGIDSRPLKGVDIVHDLEKFPWPLPDNCAHLAVASHLLEHINPHGGVFLNFMDEVWRVLRPDGEFAFVVPYAGSPGFWQDPTHCNGINEATLCYFDPLHESGLYRIYKPKPWKIRENIWHLSGNLEAVLIKRREDPSYG
jgi:SAM-dependent methyltransferase